MSLLTLIGWEAFLLSKCEYVFVYYAIIFTEVMSMTPSKEAELIYSRIEPLFKRMSRTRYNISISNDIYDKTYNFFFESQHAGMRLKSTPLHSLADYRLEFLEQVVDELKKHTQLTINYTGFTGEVWPAKQAVIQKTKSPLE